ncbi:MAG: hypothetical protein HY675_24730 [Chloroflexi bacterium]|nr:hypothetical protein [Chloroflexota bacterium]
MHLATNPVRAVVYRRDNYFGRIARLVAATAVAVMVAAVPMEVVMVTAFVGLSLTLYT